MTLYTFQLDFLINQLFQNIFKLTLFFILKFYCYFNYFYINLDCLLYFLTKLTNHSLQNFTNLKYYFFLNFYLHFLLLLLLFLLFLFLILLLLLLHFFQTINLLHYLYYYHCYYVYFYDSFYLIFPKVLIINVNLLLIYEYQFDFSDDHLLKNQTHHLVINNFQFTSFIIELFSILKTSSC